MNHTVVAKQAAAKECFICGTENEAGLHASFYELDNKKVACVFTAKDIHAGHPGILHGGVICSILDETAGRAMTILAPENTGALTVQLDTTYQQMVPTHTRLIAAGWVEEVREKVYIARSEIYLPDGTVAASARGVYYFLKGRTSGDPYHKVFPQEMDLWEVDIPETDGPQVTEV